MIHRLLYLLSVLSGLLGFLILFKAGTYWSPELALTAFQYSSSSVILGLFGWVIHWLSIEIERVKSHLEKPSRREEMEART